MINSICIVRLSALGDVLMLVPLVRTLQANFPNATITWVISKPAYYLVESIEGIEFIVIDKPNSIRDYWKFKKLVYHRKFDVLLATQASFRANLLYGLISAKRKIGYDKIRAKDGHRWFTNESILPGREHTLEGFLKFATALHVAQPVIEWNLPIDAVDKEWAEQITQSYPFILVVNPAASKPERSWLTQHYVEVINYAKLKWNARIILTGGPGNYDRMLADDILKQTSAIDLVGKTHPKQLLALISQCHLMLCPDTGPSHMANAVGTPVIALHAVTSSEVSGAYNYQHLAVDYYPQAVKIIQKKQRGEILWGTHIHGNETMNLIPVDAVKAQVDRFLASELAT